MNNISHNNLKRATINQAEILTRLKNIVLPDFDCVIGISTGGSQPAKMISAILNIPLFHIYINFRSSDNSPQYKNPQFERLDHIPEGIRKILLVDDVSVSGKTLRLAQKHLKGYSVETLVLKGHADYVIFPELHSCVNWPWTGI